MIELSETYKTVTGCGNLYVTITERNKILTNMGKAGGCAYAFSYALKELINLCVESNISRTEIIRRLKGIKCHMENNCINELITILEKHYENKNGNSKNI